MAYQDGKDGAMPPIVPVAVPLPVAIDDGDTPIAPSRPQLATANLAHGQSNYQLPSSRRNGALSAVPERQIQLLVDQGYTRGHASSLAQTIRNFPLRIWSVRQASCDGSSLSLTDVWFCNAGWSTTVDRCRRWTAIDSCKRSAEAT